MSDSPGTGGRLRRLRRDWSALVREQVRIVTWSVRRSWADRVFWLLLVAAAGTSVAARLTHSVGPVWVVSVLVLFILYTAVFLTWQIRSNKRDARARVVDAMLAAIMWQEEQRLARRGVDGRKPPFALPEGGQG